MGNPFLFADRFSGAVVHLTTGYPASIAFTASQLAFRQKKKQNACGSRTDAGIS
jgi:hypothetical protein